jgi:hypothetical protein
MTISRICEEQGCCCAGEKSWLFGVHVDRSTQPSAQHGGMLRYRVEAPIFVELGHATGSDGREHRCGCADPTCAAVSILHLQHRDV